MPFVRFTTDRRGIEHTCVMHGSGSDGRGRPRLLYWFRTPPHVKVGRHALDEETIRLIEEHNPHVRFDWARILKTQVSGPMPGAEASPRRRRAVGARRDESRAPREPAETTVETGGAAVEEAPAVLPDAAQEALLGAVPGSGPAADEELPPEPADEGAFARPSAVEALLAPEELLTLRGRYAALLARISETPDPARRDALRLEAEPLNPDTWVTAPEVARGRASFEEGFAALKARLGRRRSRRGGRRRRRAGAPAAPPAGPEDPPEGSR